MKTVKEISRMTGVSVRTLQYYDKIGLLKPASYTEAGYRLYDDTSLERLSQILLFRELEFPLSEIKAILSAPDFDRNRALEQQIEMLELKQEHLENLILFARGIYLKGMKGMDFTAFDRTKLDEYAARAKAEWGTTPQYQEMEEKQKSRTAEDEQALMRSFMHLFTEFGAMRTLSPEAEQVQAQVRRLQAFITEHLYTCGGEIAENIDRAGGEGTAKFAAEAIAVYCGT